MKILNFGSMNIDYVYHLEHFVQNGETINSNKLDVNCGGKGLNQSVALAKAGAYVYHAGMLGKDDGDILLNTLKDYGVNCDYVKPVNQKSGHAIIQVNNTGENCIILFGGANQMIDEEYVNSVLDNFAENDFCVLQNEISCMDYIMQKCHEKGMKIVLNPSPCNDKILNAPLDLVDFFLINEVEGEQMTGLVEPESIIAELSKRFPKSSIVLTLGKNGVIYKSDEGTFSCGIYDNVKVLDTTSAGDTFTGYFIDAVLNNLTPQQTLTLASAGSSLAVSRHGASISIPYKNEVEQFIRDNGQLDIKQVSN